MKKRIARQVHKIIKIVTEIEAAKETHLGQEVKIEKRQILHVINVIKQVIMLGNVQIQVVVVSIDFPRKMYFFAIYVRKYCINN